MPTAPRPRRERRVAAALLAAYLVGLALIAFWPQHVDRDAGPLLRAIARVLPWATQPRVEFSANVALFLPFGALLTLLLRRRALLSVAVGGAASLMIELAQGMLLPGRTASALDVLANTLGTAAGVALVLLARRRPRSAGARPDRGAPPDDDEACPEQH